MGVIRSQSIKGAIFLYMGVVIGFITQALILPNYFTEEQNGLIKLFSSYSLIFAQFGGLGLLILAVRYAPYFADDRAKRNRFFTRLVVLSLVGAILASGCFLATQSILSGSPEENKLLLKHLPWTVVLISAIVWFNIMDAFMRTLLQSTQGVFLKEFVQRVLILFTAGLVIFQVIGFGEFVVGYLIAFIIPATLITFLLFRKKQMGWEWGKIGLNKEQKREMRSVAGISLLAGFSNLGLSHIDSIMVEEYIDLKTTGSYAIAGYFAVLIAIPSRNVFRIIMPVLAESFAKEKWQDIKQIYQKSSLTLSIIGGLLLLGLYANLDNVFRLLPPEYSVAKPALPWLALSNFLIMFCGGSAQLIANSRLFKYNGYLGLMLVVLAIITNILMIPAFGIQGAALASLISMVVYKGAKAWLIYHHFKIWPTTKKTLWVFVVGIIVALIISSFPAFPFLIVDIGVVSSATIILFLAPLYMLKVSPDINTVIDQTWKTLVSLILKKRGVGK